MSEGARHSWGGDSVSGKVGTRAPVVVLVLAWIEGRDGGREALAAHCVEEDGATALAAGVVEAYLTDDAGARRYVVVLSEPALRRLHNREFRRPYKPAPSSFLVALDGGVVVEFVARKEATRVVQSEDIHVPAKAWEGPPLTAAGRWPAVAPQKSDLFSDYNGVGATIVVGEE